MKRYFVLHDGLGSTICLTDSAANIKRTLIYSDFGERLIDTTASTVPSLNRLYAGYSWDASPANFYWMPGRQSYDPVIGRFGQEDPVNKTYKMPPNLNLYLYVTNNPASYIDPTGLFKIVGKCCGKDDIVRKAVQEACNSLGKLQITDNKLRNCLLKRCMSNGVLNCNPNCGKNIRGEEIAGYKSAWDRFWGIKPNEVTVCPNAAGFEKCAGDVVIHEWAHSCGWNHGEGQGIPGDSGYIECGQ
jgi:RHS repeat-associated protein